MKLSEIQWATVLKNVGGIVTTFNPAIGSGLIVASEVVDKFDGDAILSDNQVLKNNVVGLSACADILTDYLQKVELNQAPTTDNLKLVLVSIQSLDTLLDKNYAIMK